MAPKVAPKAAAAAPKAKAKAKAGAIAHRPNGAAPARRGLLGITRKPNWLRGIERQVASGDIICSAGQVLGPHCRNHMVEWLLQQPPAEQGRVMQLLAVWRPSALRQILVGYSRRLQSSRSTINRSINHQVHESRPLVVSPSGVIMA